MLPRTLLLPLRQEYNRIRKTGRWHDSASFKLLVSSTNYQLRTTDSPARFAVVVSKKVSLKSVVRHQIKRRLCDAVVSLLVVFPPNLDIVIFAKKEAIGKTAGELKQELEIALK